MEPRMVISCPCCLRQYEADPALAGKTGMCAACGEPFLIAGARLATDAGEPVLFETALVPNCLFFQDACDVLARNACKLLRLTGDRPTPENVARVAGSIAHGPSRLLDEQWKRGYCHRLFERVYERARTPEEEVQFRALIDYFAGHLPTQRAGALRMLIAAFRGVLGGLDRDMDAPGDAPRKVAARAGWSGWLRWAPRRNTGTPAGASMPKDNGTAPCPDVKDAPRL